MTDKQPSADSHIVTRGAGLAFLGRMGALFEPVSVVVFAQLYGAPNLGLFLLLWGYVQLVVAATDLATSVALQRFIPSTKDEDKVHAILKASILVSIVLSVIASLALTLAAPWLATHINAEEGVSGDLSLIIATYAWAIPVWCLVEVTTAAMRARRAFGPEVRIRVLYEQGLRLISGVTFFLMGMPIYGLFLSHLLAITVTLVASFYNLRRYYDLRRAWAAPLKAAGLRELVRFGLPMVGTASLKKFQSNFPIFLLNFIIPGAQGATAVAVYSVARKVSSALQGIRMSFDYVIAPLA
ncbi:MAG: oligosaccharide flippase family protein, partial [Sphingomonadales bacterium]|nr:oligosaccharide flippase family protein [Sphingomonadales bacterium]